MPSKLPFGMYDELGNEVKKLQVLRFSPLWENLSAQEPASTPRVDVYREDDHLVVKAVLPGVRKEDIHLALEGGACTCVGT